MLGIPPMARSHTINPITPRRLDHKTTATASQQPELANRSFDNINKRREKNRSSDFSVEMPNMDGFEIRYQVDRGQQVDSDLNNQLEKNPEEEHLRRVRHIISLQSRPTCLSNLILDRPCLIMCLGMVLLGVFAWLSIELDVWNFSKESLRQNAVLGDETLKDWDMQVATEKYLASTGNGVATAVRSR